MISPCSDCPWRRDAPRAHWHPDEFRKIWTACQDDGMHFMLCHKSRPKEGIEIPCAGYCIVIGPDSIGWRIAVSRGKIDPDQYRSEVPLYQSFAELMRAHGVKPPPRNQLVPMRRRRR